MIDVFLYLVAAVALSAGLVVVGGILRIGIELAFEIAQSLVQGVADFVQSIHPVHARLEQIGPSTDLLNYWHDLPAPSLEMRTIPQPREKIQIPNSRTPPPKPPPRKTSAVQQIDAHRQCIQKLLSERDEARKRVTDLECMLIQAADVDGLMKLQFRKNRKGDQVISGIMPPQVEAFELPDLESEPFKALPIRPVRSKDRRGV